MAKSRHFWYLSTALLMGLLTVPVFGQQDDYSQQQDQNQQYDSQDSQRDQQMQRRDDQDSRYDRDRNQNQQSSQYDDQQDYNQQHQRSNQGQYSQNDQQNQPAGLGVTITQSRNGVQVDGVFRDSPADQAGIRRFDEITAVDGQQVRSTDQLISVIRRKDPGTQVQIQLRRNGEQRTVNAQLERRQEALEQLGALGSQQRYGYGWQGQGSSEMDSRGQGAVMNELNQLQRQVRQLSSELADIRSMLQRNRQGSNMGNSSDDYRSSRMQSDQYRSSSNPRQYDRD